MPFYIIGFENIFNIIFKLNLLIIDYNILTYYHMLFDAVIYKVVKN